MASGEEQGALLGRLVATQRTEQTAARSVPLDHLGRLVRKSRRASTVVRTGGGPGQTAAYRTVAGQVVEG